MLIVLGFVLFWVLCGIFAYGRAFALLEWCEPWNPIKINRKGALIFGFMGLIGLIGILIISRGSGCGLRYTDGCKWVKR